MKKSNFFAYSQLKGAYSQLKGSLKGAQKIQSNESVDIAYNWLFDELQASEFLTFPFSKLKLKFSI